MRDEGGYYLDNGTKIDEDSIPVPSLCQSCIKNRKEVVACNLTRMDEIQKGEMFCCFAFEPTDPSMDTETLFREMEAYTASNG